MEIFQYPMNYYQHFSDILMCISQNRISSFSGEPGSGPKFYLA